MIKHLAVACYPEHCDEARWPRDIALMRQHGIDTVRILEFAWIRLERADGQWNFAWAHRAMKLFEDAGLGVVLCTPSAAPPAWLTGRFPETLCLKRRPARRARHAALKGARLRGATAIFAPASRAKCKRNSKAIPTFWRGR